MEGQSVHMVRQRCGRALALEAPIEADIISTVPASATAAALGFSHASGTFCLRLLVRLFSGIPYNEVLSKNRYIGRTFIQPDQRFYMHLIHGIN